MSTASKLFENTEIPDCNAYQARYVLYLGISCKTIFVNFQSVMANSLFYVLNFSMMIPNLVLEFGRMREYMDNVKIPLESITPNNFKVQLELIRRNFGM